MADDFEIRVGIESAGGVKGEQGTAGIGLGVSKGLKLAGVVGFLSQLKIVTDTISIVLQLIQVGIVGVISFLGGLFGLFLTKVVPFFEDPTRSLIRFGLFIVNGIITGLEFVINGILGIFRRDPIELPRFREDVLLDSLEGPGSFVSKLANSLMTNAEYMDFVNERQRENQEVTDQALQSGKVFAEIVKAGFEQTGFAFSPAFDAMNGVARLLIVKSNEISRSLGAGTTSGFVGPPSARDLINQKYKQSTTLTQKEARSGLYLLNKLGGS